MLSLLTRKYFVPVKRNGNLCEDSPRCNPQSLDNERCSGFNNKQINMFRLQLTSGDFFFIFFSLSCRSIAVHEPTPDAFAMEIYYTMIKST